MVLGGKIDTMYFSSNSPSPPFRVQLASPCNKKYRIGIGIKELNQIGNLH